MVQLADLSTMIAKYSKFEFSKSSEDRLLVHHLVEIVGVLPQDRAVGKEFEDRNEDTEMAKNGISRFIVFSSN